MRKANLSLLQIALFMFIWKIICRNVLMDLKQIKSVKKRSRELHFYGSITILAKIRNKQTMLYRSSIPFGTAFVVWSVVPQNAFSINFGTEPAFCGKVHMLISHYVHNTIDLPLIWPPSQRSRRSIHLIVHHRHHSKEKKTQWQTEREG